MPESLAYDSSSAPPAEQAMAGAVVSLNDVHQSLQYDGFLPEMAMGGAGVVYCRRFEDDAAGIESQLQELIGRASSIVDNLGFTSHNYRNAEADTLQTLISGKYPAAPRDTEMPEPEPLDVAGTELLNGSAEGANASVAVVSAAKNILTKGPSLLRDVEEMGVVLPSRYAKLSLAIKANLDDAALLSPLNAAVAAYWIANGVVSLSDSAIDNIINTWWTASYRIGDIFTAVKGIRDYVFANWSSDAAETAASVFDPFVRAGLDLAGAVRDRAVRLANAVSSVNRLYDYLLGFTILQLAAIVTAVASMVFNVTAPAFLAALSWTLNAWVNAIVLLLTLVLGNLIGARAAA